MASSTISTISSLGGKLVVDLQISGSTENVNVTSATSGSVYLVEMDNQNNASFFLKIRDHATADSSNTTANDAGTPHMMLYCPARSKLTYAIPGGFAYSAGVSLWGTTSAAVGSTSSPANAVTVKLVCS